MKPVDILLTVATFIAFVLAVYLFSSDPVLSNSVNWAEDRAPVRAGSERSDLPALIPTVFVGNSAPDKAPPANLAANPSWKYIVIHHSETKRGNAKIFDNYHRNSRGLKDGLAYHFVIGNGTDSRDGEVETGNRWERQIAGAHCYDNKINAESIGVCLVGDFNKSRPTDRQIKSLLKLISGLQKQHGISKSNILLHKEADKNRTDCPGRKFQAGKIR
ncbi:MAG: peptidoglycan recognition family protein [Planctomycetota bacterium]